MQANIHKDIKKESVTHLYKKENIDFLIEFMRPFLQI